jgi:glycosyltransferase involved in cell wall biosynthesis
VAYVAHAFDVGGAEEMVLNLVRHLPSRFEPVVCCIHHAGTIADEIRATGARVDMLGLTPGVRRPFDFGGVRRYFRELRPHIAHTFLMTGSLYGRLAAILERVPIIIGTEVNIYARKLRRHIFAERLLMAGTDRVIVSARTVREFYLRQLHADPAKVDVIYNAVDWDRLTPTMTGEAVRMSLGIPAAADVAGIIARLNSQKGHAYLLEALARTPALREVHLIVVGDGELRSDLERQTAALGLHARVHFVGGRRDLGNLLGAMDAFAMPSLWEGLPLSLVLAMGAGIPVVATPVGGVAEVVVDERNGLVVPPGDAAALGRALARLFADAALRDRLSHEARAIRPRFGIDTYVTQVVALYDRLLAGGRTRGLPAS